MNLNKKFATIGSAVAIVGVIGGWLLSDMWKRGAESEKMTQLEIQIARIPDIESQRQREKDRADRLDLEVASLMRRIDDVTKTYGAENARLYESLLAYQKELSAANFQLLAQQKCAYLDELTRDSKKTMDNQTSIGVVGNADVFARQETERRQQLLNEFEKNRAALIECLKG
ncbi:hypothetical protein F7P85_02870 [Kerstersia gyiorum]|nr:hypothetical protein [Kerstersia gyiorum]KAB0544404.1 hypothetical protein F7P85_02870 [Kerstersia gyiorum]